MMNKILLNIIKTISQISFFLFLFILIVARQYKSNKRVYLHKKAYFLAGASIYEADFEAKYQNKKHYSVDPNLYN